MAVDRMEKIDELVKNFISEEVRGLFADIIISITQVKVSKDLSYAKIWVSSLEDVDQTVKLCQREGKQIKRTMASKIKLRKVPNLHFVADKTETEAFKIEKLIRKIKE